MVILIWNGKFRKVESHLMRFLDLAEWMISSAMHFLICCQTNSAVEKPSICRSNQLDCNCGLVIHPNTPKLSVSFLSFSLLFFFFFFFYNMQVIFETMRMATIVNGVLRRTTKDMELQGELIDSKQWNNLISSSLFFSLTLMVICFGSLHVLWKLDQWDAILLKYICFMSCGNAKVAIMEELYEAKHTWICIISKYCLKISGWKIHWSGSFI